MTTFGLLDSGIKIKTVEDILVELADSHRASFGPAINTAPASVLGQLDAVFGDKVAELWELLEAVYSSQYPDTALGLSLDNGAAITGASRLPAAKSTGTLRLNLTAGTTLAVGRVVSISESGLRVVTTAVAQNATGAQANILVASESEQFGPIVVSAGNVDTIETPVSGWTAQAAILSGNAELYVLSNGLTLDLQADGGATQTVTFITGDFVDIANATAVEVSDAINANTTDLEAIPTSGSVFVQSDTDGPGSSIQIVGGTANAILSFATGLVDGLTDDDFAFGANLETDVDFRIRREELIRIAGAATLEAIRSAILALDGIIQVFVFENTSLITNPSGLPGKSFEVVALGATDTAIAQSIFDTKPLGIESFRDPGINGVTVPIIDSQGTSHNINFSRPTFLQMFVEVDVSVSSAVFGGGDVTAGEQQVKDAMALIGSQQLIGQDVIIKAFECVLLDSQLGVAGVVDVTSVKIEAVFPPTNTANIVVSVRELATFDTSDIVVNVTVV